MMVWTASVVSGITVLLYPVVEELGEVVEVVALGAEVVVHYDAPATAAMIIIRES